MAKHSYTPVPELALLRAQLRAIRPDWATWSDLELDAAIVVLLETHETSMLYAAEGANPGTQRTQ
jgi:hypothetical protein